MDAVRTLQRIISSDYRMAALQTTEPERLLALFKRLTMTTGQAIYHWQPENGLYRLGAEHILIPRTRSSNEVVAYIKAAKHYGVYLLEGFESALSRQSIQGEIHTIVQRDDDVRRLMLFMGDTVTIPEPLKPYAAIVRQNPAAVGEGQAQHLGDQAG
jgi:hypothetical protein